LKHNDIKPGNILFSEERGAVLCDFGLSRQSVLSSLTAGGRPFYVPPEYITVKQRGQPGDVFALGVTMLYLRKLRPLPDFAEGQYFMIADIHSQMRVVRQAARNKRVSWLAEVEAARARLELSSTDAFII
jgi:serine/threonine protein kinase